MTPPESDFPEQIERLVPAARCSRGGLLARDGPIQVEDARWGEHRDYAPGDDYRWIDWRVCARHDELVSRRPPGCSDRCVYVLLDCSRSMATGRPPKLDVARRVAAALGAAALGRLDPFAVLAFADRIVAELPRVRGRLQWLKMLRFLESLSPEGATTDLAGAAQCLARRGGPPGVAVVVGDFFVPDSYRRGLEILRHQGHAPCVVHVCDSGDAQPQALGDVELCDIESGDRWTTVLGPRELERHRRLYEEFRDSVRSFCRQRKIAYLRVSETTSWKQLVFEATGQAESRSA